jgi:plastocyanin
MVDPLTPQAKVFLLSVGVNEYRARPAFTAVAPGNRVRFVNLTGGSVVLTFSGDVFDKTTLTLTSGGKDTVTVQDRPDGRYAYTGLVNGNSPVQGESSPEIIVDR